MLVAAVVTTGEFRSLASVFFLLSHRSSSSSLRTFPLFSSLSPLKWQCSVRWHVLEHTSALAGETGASQVSPLPFLGREVGLRVVDRLPSPH